jgi:FixJ family two-component response regulator
MMTSGSAASLNGRPTILLVEDDAAVRRSLQLLLSSRGYDVRSYGSSIALLADAANRTAVCFVTDYRMPELDGIAVLRSLRGGGWKGSAILITAFPTPDLARRALAEGFDIVLEKPLRGSAVADAVSRLTGGESRPG